ncbi:MAG: hypothetical protein KDB14_02265 [Planctomycetales bacterium]|nr:hypothetical protein [Planctomycetales bacterium]
MQRDLLSREIQIDSIDREIHPQQCELVIAPNNNLSEIAGAVEFVREHLSRHYSASFAAKPLPDAPGNGCHFHLHVADGNGRNLLARATRGAPQTEWLRQTIAGLCSVMRESMVFFSPQPADYQRYIHQPTSVEHRFSGAPTTVSWGANNRTCALRIPDVENLAAQRIEHRLPCASCDPWLSLAAIVAGVAIGRRDSLELTRPQSFTDARVIDEGLPPLPRTFAEAATAYAHSRLHDELFGQTPLRFLRLLDDRLAGACR